MTDVATPKLSEADEIALSDVDDPLEQMSRSERRKAERRARRLTGALGEYPHLIAMKPREKYLFHSDYFRIDDTYACILGYFHDDGARDTFSPFWGINRIPSGLPEGVSTVVFEQVRRLGEKWVDDHLKSAETAGNLAERETGTGSSATGRRKIDKSRNDFENTVAELQDGASYLHVHDRLLVKAPTLEALDTAIERLRRLYVDRFATVKVAAYAGEQRRELSTLTNRNSTKRGKGFHYTSTEFAGSHSLVTNGLNDPAGEYVGHMVGDVNNSAVLLDVDDYDHHVVAAFNGINTVLGRTPEADLWGSKMSQAAMLNNHRVVHIVLDGANLDLLGPRLDNLTARLDLSRGDVNMLEMFGRHENELLIFSAHLDKVVLMTEQAYETSEAERSIIRGSLRETLTQFYVDKQMWAYDAKRNRERLRLVGLPHSHVPRLQDVMTYFATEYKALANSSARDPERLHAYSVLSQIFRDLVDTNGDIFNNHTADAIDGVGAARRVIYDFSDLMARGKGVAMAQLVNMLGFAIGSMSVGDLMIIHGTELIDERVRGYVKSQVDLLYRCGGRMAYLYNSIEGMLADDTLNRFDAADYTVLGNMRAATMQQYQEQLHQSIPPDLETLVTSGGDHSAYLRRAHINVVFQPDLALGVNPHRADRRAALKAQMPPIEPQNGKVTQR